MNPGTTGSPASPDRNANDRNTEDPTMRGSLSGQASIREKLYDAIEKAVEKTDSLDEMYQVLSLYIGRQNDFDYSAKPSDSMITKLREGREVVAIFSKILESSDKDHKREELRTRLNSMMKRDNPLFGLNNGERVELVIGEASFKILSKIRELVARELIRLEGVDFDTTIKGKVVSEFDDIGLA